VTIAPEPGVSGDAVAYGVVIQAVPAPGGNSDVRQITAAIAQSLESGDGNMKQSGDIQTITVDGVAAGSVELQTVAPMRDAQGKVLSERD
jgi:hypothetical protein